MLTLECWSVPTTKCFVMAFATSKMVRRYKRVPTSPAIVIEKQFLRQRLFLFFTVDKRAFVTFRANNMKIPIQQCLIFLHLQIESSKLDVDCIKINSVKMCFSSFFLGWWQVALFNLEPSWFYGRFGVGMCMAGSVRALYKGGIPRKHICRFRFPKSNQGGPVPLTTHTPVIHFGRINFSNPEPTKRVVQICFVRDGFQTKKNLPKKRRGLWMNNFSLH